MYKPGYDSFGNDEFADQFEWGEGDDYLYRFRNIGAAYCVTPDERDAFVAAYARRRK